MYSDYMAITGVVLQFLYRVLQTIIGLNTF